MCVIGRDYNVSLSSSTVEALPGLAKEPFADRTVYCVLGLVSIDPGRIASMVAGMWLCSTNAIGICRTFDEVAASTAAKRGFARRERWPEWQIA
jgi:hypothetical protein